MYDLDEKNSFEMHTIKNAKKKVEDLLEFLNNLMKWNYDFDAQIAILDEHTEERESVWIFHYNSLSGNESHELLSNGPLFVNKVTLQIHEGLGRLSTDDNFKFYMENMDQLSLWEKDEEEGIWDNHKIHITTTSKPKEKEGS